MHCLLDRLVLAWFESESSKPIERFSLSSNWVGAGGLGVGAEVWA